MDSQHAVRIEFFMSASMGALRNLLAERDHKLGGLTLSLFSVGQKASGQHCAAVN